MVLENKRKKDVGINMKKKEEVKEDKFNNN